MSDDSKLSIDQDTENFNETLSYCFVPTPDCETQTFEQLIREMYYSNCKYEQIRSELEETLQEVKDSDQLYSLIYDCINEFATGVQQNIREDIKKYYAKQKQLKEKYCIEIFYFIVKIFQAQLDLEEISREVDKVVQLYHQSNSRSLNEVKKEFKCIDEHKKLLDDQIYSDSRIKEFLDEISKPQDINDEQNDQVLRTFQVLLKKQPPLQLPQPNYNMTSHNAYPNRGSRFVFANQRAEIIEPVDYFAKQYPVKRNSNDPLQKMLREDLSQFNKGGYFSEDKFNNEQQASISKRRRNKKKKNQNTQRSDACTDAELVENFAPTPHPQIQSTKNIKRIEEKISDCSAINLDEEQLQKKSRDEIKDFERRLEAAHINHKNTEKVQPNITTDWLKKISQLIKKTAKVNAAKR